MSSSVVRPPRQRRPPRKPCPVSCRGVRGGGLVRAQTSDAHGSRTWCASRCPPPREFLGMERAWFEVGMRSHTAPWAKRAARASGGRWRMPRHTMVRMAPGSAVKKVARNSGRMIKCAGRLRDALQSFLFELSPGEGRFCHVGGERRPGGFLDLHGGSRRPQARWGEKRQESDGGRGVCRCWRFAHYSQSHICGVIKQRSRVLRRRTRQAALDKPRSNDWKCFV